MARPFAWIRRPRLAGVALAAVLACGAQAQTAAQPAEPPPAPPVQNSSLDAVLFYQLLIGELELRAGQPGVAFEVLLDAARRHRDEALYRRAVEVALQSRAGDQALAATRAWRQSAPGSIEALRTQLQILLALNRLGDTAEPLERLLAVVPAPERGGLIASLPRFFSRASDNKAAAAIVDKALTPFLADAELRIPALVASGRMQMAAGDTDKALTLARAAAAANTGARPAPGPALLALELMGKAPAAEQIVLEQLQASTAEPALRLAYARVLIQSQRHADAIAQLERLTRDQPEQTAPWLTLGALHVELRHPDQAQAALQRYVQLVQKDGEPATAGEDDDGDGDEGDQRAGLTQAWLLLAQTAELRGDFKAAEAYLARVDSPQRALDVLTRRATLLARQNRLAEARDLLRKAPERSADDARAKVMAEAQVLRDVKQWRASHQLLADANKRWPQDVELLYELAMMAEKLDRVDEMERHLRRVIELKPDHQHAYNALGYSLADRGLRLPEARALIVKALEFAPGDPFITDSLGWVEFRLGNHAEALRLLRQAYASRPDTEIAAHLGEVLWVTGQRDEARRVWREGASRDAANEVLRETLARLKPGL